MKSSVFSYYLIKIGFGLLLLLLLVAIGVAMVDPEFDSEVTRSEKHQMIACVLILPPLLGYVIWRCGVVDCRSDVMELRRNGKTTMLEWAEVASIKQMPFCTPPLYRIAFRNGEPPVFVMMHSWVVATVGFWSWDFTGFSDYVKERIAQSSITS